MAQLHVCALSCREVAVDVLTLGWHGKAVPVEAPALHPAWPCDDKMQRPPTEPPLTVHFEEYGAHDFFLVRAVFSFNLRPPASIVLRAPSFHLSCTITCRQASQDERQRRQQFYLAAGFQVSLVLRPSDSKWRKHRAESRGGLVVGLRLHSGLYLAQLLLALIAHHYCRLFLCNKTAQAVAEASEGCPRSAPENSQRSAECCHSEGCKRNRTEELRQWRAARRNRRRRHAVLWAAPHLPWESTLSFCWMQ